MTASLFALRRASPRAMAGLTLVELMSVVAIIGVLAGIAVPNYTEYIRRTARADAQLVLQQAANHLERVYAECNSYLVRDASTVPPCTTAVPALPAELTRAPQSGTQRYTIALTARTAQGYELQATPLASTDACGVFTLRSTGERLASGALGATMCWRR